MDPHGPVGPAWTGRARLAPVRSPAHGPGWVNSVPTSPRRARRDGRRRVALAGASGSDEDRAGTHQSRPKGRSFSTLGMTGSSSGWASPRSTGWTTWAEIRDLGGPEAIPPKTYGQDGTVPWTPVPSVHRRSPSSSVANVPSPDGEDTPWPARPGWPQRAKPHSRRWRVRAWERIR
jgi:hypothetical protein